MQVEATSPSGATVTYSASAADTVDGGVTPSCSPASGSTFPMGTTRVSCTARDARGNAATASFDVAVVDRTPPVIAVPGPITAEAAGADGAPVSFTVSAVDAVDGPLAPASVSCSNASDSTFALGTTTVTCTATDASGNAQSSSFAVTVVDTTPPRLNVAAPVAVTGSGSVSASNSTISAFLAAAQARDLVDGVVAVQNDAPSSFAEGTTTVTFTASDRKGNVVVARSTVQVTRQATPPPPPPDTTPPGEVSQLKARELDGAVALSWALPRDPDLDHVVVEQRIGLDPPKIVYTGDGTDVTVRGLRNGVSHRFVAITYDHTGNASVGVAVVATPKEPMLLSPADGASVPVPTALVWKAVPGATYYNVQLYRLAADRTTSARAAVKLLSSWPTTTRFTVRRSWTYRGRLIRLAPGTYRWYVWPGVGPRAKATYGALLGQSTFVVAPGSSAAAPPARPSTKPRPRKAAPAARPRRPR
jgi:hypothetical protein